MATPPQVTLPPELAATGGIGMSVEGFNGMLMDFLVNLAENTGDKAFRGIIDAMEILMRSPDRNVRQLPMDKFMEETTKFAEHRSRALGRQVDFGTLLMERDIAFIHEGPQMFTVFRGVPFTDYHKRMTDNSKEYVWETLRMLNFLGTLISKMPPQLLQMTERMSASLIQSGEAQNILAGGQVPDMSQLMSAMPGGMGGLMSGLMGGGGPGGGGLAALMGGLGASPPPPPPVSKGARGKK